MTQPSDRDAAAWRVTAAAIRAEAAAVPAPGPELFARVAAQLSSPHPATTPNPVVRPIAGYGAATHRLTARPAVAVRLMLAQLRILHRAVWPATALVLALGVTLAAIGPDHRAADLLGLIAPLVGTLALAALPAPGAEPEFAVASGTSPRTVLLARLAVLSTWTAGLAFVASLVLTGDNTLTTLVESWLGPFALLTAVSVVGAVLSRPSVGVAAAVALWGLRCVTRTPGAWEPLARVVDRWWTTNLTVLAVAVTVTAVAVGLAPVNPHRLRNYSEA
ncbi:hypothetical protein [Cryptosporangium arvum]|uniref:Uncharacterized protein n=1 Tax=Cryptosporangium arvum DSM 44712 TaxID=927661 RepID=A0A010YQ90_9ACTN|nr:hypothetical protein [Cryptosporangium arvum]EXG82355.1 hypothetical protein CryarDRAFT_3531 [Cryptosporangium arvum DSM 44712]